MDLLIALDRTAGPPLSEQIYTGVRTAIVDGQLPPGARLASTRELARQLGVARFTVDDAYNRLAAEGYILGRQGSGTYVADHTPLALPQTSTGLPKKNGRRELSQWGQRLALCQPHAQPPVDLPFTFDDGTPALHIFPWTIWQRLQTRVGRDLSYARYGYGSTAGLPALREAIAAYLARSRGVRCEPEQVVITSGVHQSMDLLTRLLLDPGDQAFVEEPGYPAVRAILSLAGAELLPIPVDSEGLRVDRLPSDRPAAKLIFVTPSHQSPTGAILPLRRRLDLLHWAGQAGVLIVEDDYDSELRYDARPVPALAALSGAQRDAGSVVYLGTFSKVLFPALRLGYVVLPNDLVEPYVGAKRVVERHAPTLAQATVAAFIIEGHFERHLARMRRLYAARQAALIHALDMYLAGIAHRNTEMTAAGLHLIVGFDIDLSEQELIRRAAAHGIALSGASDCFITPPSRPHLLLGYAAMSEDRITAGIRKLAAALGR